MDIDNGKFGSAFWNKLFEKVNIWLALIKITIWIINYKKWQCINKGVYY